MVSEWISEVLWRTNPAEFTKGGQCMTNTNGNTKYSSDVFSMLLQDKNRALEIYNAMNGTTYDDPEEVAIEQAINRCIRENVLKDFLIQHREEVTHMMTMDYTFERRLELQREEAVEEGREEGMKEKLYELICKKLLKNKSLEQIAEELEEDPETIRPLYEQIKEEMGILSRD